MKILLLFNNQLKFHIESVLVTNNILGHTEFTRIIEIHPHISRTLKDVWKLWFTEYERNELGHIFLWKKIYIYIYIYIYAKIKNAAEYQYALDAAI
jgi:hypothetical protein